MWHTCLSWLCEDMVQMTHTETLLCVDTSARGSVVVRLTIVREHMSRYKVPWAFLEENKPPIQKC